jgi:hypothetical protein
MLRPGWILISSLTVLLTAFALSHPGRFGLLCSARAAPRRVDLHGDAGARDPFLTDAGVRWRNSQPVHWRACLIQP